ncbi:MAG TPA: Smr/MutS family protein [Dokdonella sp.]|nr:Smr/MutS family protein [Dokdonella sp.]
MTRSDDKPWSARVRDALRRRAVAAREPIEDVAANAEDARLFRSAIGEVRRLPEPEAADSTRPRPAPEPLQSERDEASVRDELLTHAIDHGTIELGEEISYLKPGQPPKLLQKLRRGQFSVRAEIDLHEMSVAVAREAIRQFLDDCRRHDELCVRIVHGKGLRSKAQGPVLKQLTDGLLRRRADVLAFTSARPAQGGTGAVIVLLQGL